MFEAIVTMIIGVIEDPLLVALILGFLPISEVRGAAIYAFSLGQPWLILPAIASNIVVSPIILALWNIVNIPYWGKLILGQRLENRLLSVGKRYETQGLIAIILLIGIPLPLTGVYSGTLVAELLGIKRRHTLTAAVVGVIISASMMFLLLGGAGLLLSN